jgi:hypothetical protein
VIIELVLFATTVFLSSPFLCAVPVGMVDLGIFSAKQRSANFNAKIVDGNKLGVHDKDKPLTIVKHKHVLVVFIHGTLFPVPSLSAMQEWAESRLKRDAHNMSYLDLLRDKSIFRHQPIGPIGLHSVLPALSSTASGAELISWFFQEMYKLLPNNEFALVHPFTFGWDGSLSLSRRKEQAKVLLEALYKTYTALKYTYPFEDFEIVIEAHSHGGNLALHMADWVSEAQKFKIDHLFIFGTPIHGDTQHLPASPLFKNVYNFHSEGDFIQVADIVSTNKYMPARVFADKIVLASLNVKQVVVEIGSYSPNHSELWFFRRPSVLFFRAGLPIAPLPVAAFVPLFLYQLKKTKNSEHFLKLFLEPVDRDMRVCLVPFQDYWNDTLMQLHQYQNHFDFSQIRKQLPLIQNE